MNNESNNSEIVSKNLKLRIPEIMKMWEERVLVEIRAAYHQETIALRDSIPDYLLQLSTILSTKTDRSQARQKIELDESIRLGKKHGKERAGSINYTMDQMILEYHILRQVIFDVLENEIVVNPIEREVIVCSIEQAVNDAATQFSETLKDLQEQLSQDWKESLEARQN